MRRFVVVLFLAGVIAFATSSLGAVLVIIDDFVEGDNMSVFPGASDSTSQDYEGAIGGNRYVTLDADSGGSGLQLQFLFGQLHYGSFAGTPGSMSIEWGRGSDLNTDFTGTGGRPAFWRAFTTDSSTETFDAKLTITAAGSSQSITHQIGPDQTDLAVQWNYADYDTLDLSDVDNILLELIGIGGGGDVDMHFFQGGSVPEPSSLAFFFGGAVLVFGCRRSIRRES